MGVVIRIPTDEWLTMKMLKEDLRLSKEHNHDGRFDLSIKKVSSILDAYLKKYKDAA